MFFQDYDDINKKHYQNNRADSESWLERRGMTEVSPGRWEDKEHPWRTGYSIGRDGRRVADM